MWLIVTTLSLFRCDHWSDPDWLKVHLLVCFVCTRHRNNTLHQYSYYNIVSCIHICCKWTECNCLSVLYIYACLSILLCIQQPCSNFYRGHFRDQPHRHLKVYIYLWWWTRGSTRRQLWRCCVFWYICLVSQKKNQHWMIFWQIKYIYFLQWQLDAVGWTFRH